MSRRALQQIVNDESLEDSDRVLAALKLLGAMHGATATADSVAMTCGWPLDRTLAALEAAAERGMVNPPGTPDVHEPPV